MNTRFLGIILFSLLIYSCTPQKKDVSLDFYETSDVHGAIFPYDFIQNKSTKTSLAQVSYYIKEQRKNKKRSTILMDNGDVLQGQPCVYYSNFVDTTTTHLVAKVMNYMKYSVGVVGNHDIEPGHAVYDRVRKQLKCKWLAANAVYKGTTNPYFQPYRFMTIKGVKIAIIGLITPEIPSWLPPNIFSGIEFLDMESAAKHWIEVVKRKHNPDIIIGVFHSGQGTENIKKLDENASKSIAKNVVGFDAIFCGHDHKKDFEKIVNIKGDTVLFFDPKARAQYIAHLSVDLKWNKEKRTYDKILKGELVDVSKIPVDTAFMKHFKPEFQAVKNYVGDTIAYLESELNSKTMFYADNALLDLIQKVQLELSGADISFSAPLQFNTTIPKGYITVSDMFKLYRFENLLYTMKLSGQEIKDYLEYSYSLWINTMKTPNDPLFLYNEKGTRFKNPFFNFDTGEGLAYSVDVRKPVGQRIHIDSLLDGRKFDLNAKYTVAINSYRGNGGGGHLTQGAHIPKAELPKRIINSSDKDLRFYMMNYLKKQKKIVPQVNHNWKLIPQAWIKKAINAEKEK